MQQAPQRSCSSLYKTNGSCISIKASAFGITTERRVRDGSSLMVWPHLQVSVKRAAPHDYVLPNHLIPSANSKWGNPRRAAEVR